MKQNNTRLEAQGPFTEEIEALAPGESATLDLRNIEKGKYARYLPFDVITLTNSNTSSEVNVFINRFNETKLLPNTEPTYSDMSVTHVTVVNPATNSGSIEDGDIKVELEKTAFDANDAARQEASRGSISGVIESFTGLKL